jgi:hypothetical protein
MSGNHEAALPDLWSATPSDPHHLRFAQSRALGHKVTDEFTVPLCRTHQREVHRCVEEGLWWQKTAIDPLAPRELYGWKHTHCPKRKLHPTMFPL